MILTRKEVCLTHRAYEDALSYLWERCLIIGRFCAKVLGVLWEFVTEARYEEAGLVGRGDDDEAAN